MLKNPDFLSNTNGFFSLEKSLLENRKIEDHYRSISATPLVSEIFLNIVNFEALL
jgi:hypothetical protein